MTIAAFRYNNPFDVSLPISGIGYGGGSVVGISGQSGYGAFPDMQTGYAAGAQRLTSYINGSSSYGPLTTINQLNTVYATDPNWSAGVSRYSGIGPNDTLNPNDPNQMANLQYGVLAQEIGPSNANQIFSNYGPNANPNPTSVFDTGVTSGPSNLDIGGLGTTNPSAYSFGGTSLGSDPNNQIGLGEQQITGGNTNFGTFGEGFTNPTPPADTGSSVAAAATGGANDTSGGGFLGGGGSSSAPDPTGSGSGLFGGAGSILGGIGGMLSGANSAGSGDPAFFNWLGDWAIRGAVIILGFVFVIAGLYMLKGNLILKEVGPALAKAA